MIPIAKLGFRTLKARGIKNLDYDVLNLITCIKNGFSREDQDIWIRDTDLALEIAVCDGMHLDRQAIISLIKCDTYLENFRGRDFAVGEIRPDVANFTLISIFKVRK